MIRPYTVQLQNWSNSDWSYILGFNCVDAKRFFTEACAVAWVLRKDRTENSRNVNFRVMRYGTVVLTISRAP